MKNQSSFVMNREDVVALRRMAKHFGYLVTRGPGAGELGNISGFLRQLASGEIVCIHREDAEGAGIQFYDVNDS